MENTINADKHENKQIQTYGKVAMNYGGFEWTLMGQSHVCCSVDLENSMAACGQPQSRIMYSQIHFHTH